MKNTKVVKINPNDIDYSLLEEAAQIIKSGGLVVFPTDTVYGLGANIYNEEACKEIFYAKQRPIDNPLLAHVLNFEQACNLVKFVPKQAKRLSDEFWPGALTLIMDKKDEISDVVTAGLDSIGTRMPNNKIALELIRLSGVPIAGTSANVSGKLSPTLPEHAINDLYGRVDMIIDGGSTSIGLESTVIKLSDGLPLIFRQGTITQEMLTKVVGECKISRKDNNDSDKSTTLSPGQKYNHYKEHAKFVLYKGYYKNVSKAINEDAETYIKQGKKVGILSTKQTNDIYNNGVVECLGDRKDLDSIALNLFSHLRNLEEQNVDVILSESFDNNNIGRVIMTRLEKASDETKKTSNFKILFVCTGNTCRSCMAEGIANDIIKKNSMDIDVMSAGLQAYNGDKASENAIYALKELDIDISSHVSRQLTDSMLKEADLILTMTEMHKCVLLRTNKELNDKIYTLKEYLSKIQYNDCLQLDILDPYGQNLVVYRQCRDEIYDNVYNIINKIY